MKALVFTSAGVVELLDREEPTVADGESLLTVQASAICGSELHGFRSVGFRTPPLIMGHEFAGTTADGRRVVVNPLLSCGHCTLCARGLPHLCRNRQLIGVNRDGGFGERVSVPTHALRDIPDDLDWTAAALIEPLANAVHAWSLIGPNPQRVGVIGAGPIGLACALLAASHGVEVVVSDVSAARRETATSLTLAAVPALTGEFDGVIDAVGIPITRSGAVERCRPGGSAVWIGLAADDVSLAGNPIVRGGKHINGSFAYTPEEFDTAVRLAPSLDLAWGTPVPLSESARVFYDLADGTSSIVKAILVPDARPDA